MPHQAFISYSKSDKHVALAVCQALEAAGIRCWIAPSDVLGGGDYRAAIVGAVEQSQAVVLVFSAHANRSKHVSQEIDLAFNVGKAIIPFRLDASALNPGLRYCLGTTHWLDALTPPLEQHIARLVEVVQRNVTGPTPGVVGASDRVNPDAALSVAIAAFDAEDYATSLPLCRQWAHRNDSHAQYYMGLHYSGGRGVERDDVEADRWLRLAAEQGHADAQALLAVNALSAPPGDPRGAEGLRWVHAAAAQGHFVAQSLLGCRYFNGDGVPRDPLEGLRLLRMSAEQGFSMAQVALADVYLNGVDLAKDLPEAVRWLEKAAGLGNSEAKLRLARCAFQGLGMSIDHVLAHRFMAEAAEQDCLDAQCELGMMFEHGVGCPKDDEQALHWSRKAAERGHVHAQSRLAAFLFEGRGTTRDPVAALAWYRKAGEAGHAQAQYAIGWLYANGDEGITCNHAEAAWWYRKAAEQGDINAQRALGAMYANGVGVKKNAIEAARWLGKAALKTPLPRPAWLAELAGKAVAKNK